MTPIEQANHILTTRGYAAFLAFVAGNKAAYAVKLDAQRIARERARAIRDARIGGR